MFCKDSLLTGLMFCLPVLSMCQVTSSITIVPQPVQAFTRDGQFELKPDTRIYFPQGKADWETAMQYFMIIANASTGYNLVAMPTNNTIKSPGENAIYFIFDEADVAEPEGYRIEVTPGYVNIRARTAVGAFYGVQSLRQMFPPQFNSPTVVKDVAWKAPCCALIDAPRFAYRGMHLDVGRHFFPVEFIKRYIDLLAYHKFNRFHWHLTEDQGWRIEIKKYPKLQTVSSCRSETVIGHAREKPVKYDGKPHCGYYTQEEIKDVVEYARKRFVTIVPEIEMPGHALAALAAYPELGCTEGPYETAKTWGVFPDVFCAGNEKTFEFIDDVLAEVCALFPGEYVHIGGDECPKDRWKLCPKCQKRMKDEGLKDEHELQSYVIRRAEAMLAKHGKKLIGWDEILEGGLAPSATVMSWRGIEGGIAAVKAGHDAIMTPSSNCYLDYYQSDPSTEPLAIGGLLTLDKVYNYEPVPADFTEAEATHILGAQGNVWTEYMDTPEYVEYMIFPRACALSELVWTPAKKKNWDDFVRRLKVQFARFDAMGVNYARSYYDIRSNFNGGYAVLSCADRSVQIKQTTDGTEPKVTSAGYYAPLHLEKTSTIKAVAVQNGKMMGKTLTVTYYVHKASGKPYTLSKQPEQYTAGERYALTNGVVGAAKTWTNWVGLVNQEIDPVIDFGVSTDFSRVTTHFLKARNSQIYPARSIEVLVSDDGEHFNSLGIRSFDVDNLLTNGIETVVIDTPGAKGRYLKVLAKPYGVIPADAPGAGNGAWLFMDEIIVE